jgi:hypothetical protein
MIIRDLIGSSLRINDKIVIDKNANVITSNIYCDVVHSKLVTSSIAEQHAMEGIVVLGDIHVDCVNTGQIKSPTLLIDASHMDVNGTISAPIVSTNQLCTLSVGAPNESLVSVKHGLESAMIKVGKLSSLSSATKVSVIGGGLDLVGGVLSVPKTFDTTSSPSNVLTSNTMSGQLLFTCRVDIANGQRESLRLLNTAITPTSLVFALVGRYVGSGMPIVQSTVVGAGMVDIYVTNNDLATVLGRNTLIPIQYLILA